MTNFCRTLSISGHFKLVCFRLFTDPALSKLIEDICLCCGLVFMIYFPKIWILGTQTMIMNEADSIRSYTDFTSISEININEISGDKKIDIKSAISPTYRYTIHMPLVLNTPKIYIPIIRNDPIVPYRAYNPWPTNYSMDQSVNLYLTWDGGHSEGRNVDYQVYLEANNDVPNLLVATRPSEQAYFDPLELSLNTTYYWQVITVDDLGRHSKGPVWNFTTDNYRETPAIGSMVTVPAGEFQMGCDPNNPAEINCFREEVPLHTVYLDTYEIDKYEVTNVEYQACVDDGRCNAPRRSDSFKRKEYYANSEYNLYPVLFVSVWDARAYCRWADKRLPTEAEWEKAARGEIDTRVWPWGDEIISCERANYADNRNVSASNVVYPRDWIFCHGEETVQVGLHPRGASPYGALDMSGNVFEWVNDYYNEQYYANSPYKNPPGADIVAENIYETHFVIRGGSYRPNWYYSRTAHRHWGHHGDDAQNVDAPYYRNNQVGFRCAR